MKLRKYRRAASKIAEKATAKRKAAASGHGEKLRGEKTASRPGSRCPSVIKYRVEIWRDGEPEFRLVSFPLEYVYGEYIARDMVLQISQKIFEWIDSKLPANHRSNFDTSVPRSLWDAEPALPASAGGKVSGKPRSRIITDADIPF